MSNHNTIGEMIRNPYRIVKYLGIKGLLKWMPDELYLKLCFRGTIGRKLNLSNPITFNEKLQWLKLNDHKNIYSKLVDKYEVKEIVAAQIGEEFIVKNYGVWNTFDEITFESLPNQFVLKCTHDSGSTVICRDKETFDYDMARARIEYALEYDYYSLGREWAYKDVKPRIIAEEYLGTNNNEQLFDYKLMVFNGKVIYSFVCTERHIKNGLKVTFFDREWNKQTFERDYPKSEEYIAKPYSYDKMVELAEILGKDIPFVRVDFYEINKSPIFGELTLYPGNGYEPFTPYEYDKILGDLITLPTK